MLFRCHHQGGNDLTKWLFLHSFSLPAPLRKRVGLRAHLFLSYHAASPFTALPALAVMRLALEACGMPTVFAKALSSLARAPAKIVVEFTEQHEIYGKGVLTN